MSAVNIIYLTDQCNFDCEYCYEKNKHSRVTASRSELKSIVDECVDEDGQTMICLFGGEPLLKFDNIEFIMNYAYSLKKNIHFNMITNGYMLSKDKFLFRYYSNYFVKNNLLTTEISFDGVGNSLRKFRGKDSTPITLKVFKSLKKLKLRYSISYTINRLNVAYYMSDIPKIFDTLGPDKITVRFDRSLNEQDYNSFINNRDFLMNSVGIGNICVGNCDQCKVCEYKDSLKYYTNRKIKEMDIKSNANPFSDF